VVANLVNLAANYVLVYGWLGGPVLGAIGSAYATLCARIVMAAMLALFVISRERRRPSGLHDVPFGPDVARMWRLLRLGLPAALQIMLEVGVFATAAALAGRISPLALAANQIVLNIAGLFFMVPLGVSAAAAVRVGQAVGRADLPAARRAGWAALAVAGGAAALTIGLFLAVPESLIRVFTDDPSVVAVGITLLAVCAVFQPFDGFQVVATGALRGVGDTRTPLLCNLAGHWRIGLPVAYILCFARGWGVVGLWVGLSAGLILIGGALVVTWHLRTRLSAARVAPVPFEIG
jgi:MATE family multidrug resistance protein